MIEHLFVLAPTRGKITTIMGDTQDVVKTRRLIETVVTFWSYSNVITRTMTVINNRGLGGLLALGRAIMDSLALSDTT